MPRCTQALRSFLTSPRRLRRVVRSRAAVTEKNWSLLPNSSGGLTRCMRFPQTRVRVDLTGTSASKLLYFHEFIHQKSPPAAHSVSRDSSRSTLNLIIEEGTCLGPQPGL